MTDAIERKNYIVELIKETKDGVSAKTIDEDCNLTPKNRSQLMSRIMKLHPEIHRSGEYHNPVYVWIEKPIPQPDIPTHSPFLINRLNKNKEGYNDPTAGRAILNVSRAETKKEAPLAGEVWSCMESNGTTAYIYVVANVSGAVQCIKLYDKAYSTAPALIGHPIEIDISKRHMIGDIERLTYKPFKYVKNRVKFKDDAVLTKVLNEIIDIFDAKKYCTEVKVVEKEVEVETEIVKEIEVIPDNYISIDQSNLNLAQAETAIWREVARGLIGRGSI